MSHLDNIDAFMNESAIYTIASMTQQYIRSDGSHNSIRFPLNQQYIPSDDSKEESLRLSSLNFARFSSTADLPEIE